MIKKLIVLATMALLLCACKYGNSDGNDTTTGYTEPVSMIAAPAYFYEGATITLKPALYPTEDNTTVTVDGKSVPFLLDGEYILLGAGSVGIHTLQVTVGSLSRSFTIDVRAIVYSGNQLDYLDSLIDTLVGDISTDYSDDPATRDALLVKLTEQKAALAGLSSEELDGVFRFFYANYSPDSTATLASPVAATSPQASNFAVDTQFTKCLAAVSVHHAITYVGVKLATALRFIGAVGGVFGVVAFSSNPAIQAAAAIGGAALWAYSKEIAAAHADIVNECVGVVEVAGKAILADLPSGVALTGFNSLPFYDGVNQPFNLTEKTQLFDVVPNSFVMAFNAFTDLLGSLLSNIPDWTGLDVSGMPGPGHLSRDVGETPAQAGDYAMVNLSGGSAYGVTGSMTGSGNQVFLMFSSASPLPATGIILTFNLKHLASGTLTSPISVKLLPFGVIAGAFNVTRTVTSASIPAPYEVSYTCGGVTCKATLYCDADSVGMVENYADSWRLDPAAPGKATLATEDGPVDGSFSKSTGSVALVDESAAQEVTPPDSTIRFFSSSTTTYNLTYNPATQTLSGTETDVVRNTWDYDGSVAECVGTATYEGHLP